MASQSETAGNIHAAYLIYIDSTSNQIETRAYEFYNIRKPIEDIESLLTLMAENGHFDGAQYPCYTDKLEALLITRVSYYAVAFANAPNLDAENPLTVIGADATTPHPNDHFPTGHTLLTPKYFRIKAKDGTDIQVAYFENRHLRRHGRTRLQKGEWESFTITPNIVVGADAHGRVRSDSGGNNMGGTVPPPRR